MIGPYNPFSDINSLDVYEYFNKKYRDVCEKYDVIYVDLSDVNELNGESYELIGNRVIGKMRKNLFETWFLFGSLLQYIRINFYDLF